MASIIYLMGPDARVDKAVLASAQQKAIEEKLPLAAVHCWQEGHGRLTDLLPIESELIELNIPLMVLVGTREMTLPGLYRHVNPLQVFEEGSSGDGSTWPLVKHPYSWPGVVIPINKLQNIIDNNQLKC